MFKTVLRELKGAIDSATEEQKLLSRRLIEKLDETVDDLDMVGRMMLITVAEILVLILLELFGHG